VFRRDRLSARIHALLELDEWRRAETALVSTRVAVACAGATQSSADTSP
jgi:hypothetical protein